MPLLRQEVPKGSSLKVFKKGLIVKPDVLKIAENIAPTMEGQRKGAGNTRPHTTNQTKNCSSTLNIDVPRHLPYSPDIATNDSNLSSSLQHSLAEKIV